MYQIKFNDTVFFKVKKAFPEFPHSLFILKNIMLGIFVMSGVF